MNTIKLLLFSLLLLCPVISIKAQSSHALVVELENGKKTTFVLTEKPELSFTKRMLKINVNGQQTNFEISDVKQFFFEQVSADISSPTADNLRIEYPSNDQIVIEGFDRNAVIQLYSINGMQYPNYVNIDNGRALISLDFLPKGTYIINIMNTTNQQTFKIFKK